MAQLSSPITFSPGQVLTAADLMAHVNSATLLAGSINDQTAITAFDIQSTDTFNIYDASGAVLRKATVDDLFRSGQIAKFDNISGKAGQNLAITPASGYAVAINGGLTASGTLAVTSTSTLSGDVIAGANLTVVGTAAFNTTEAIKIPVGTTAQRPASPVIGQIRFNSTLAATEIYNGTSWDPVPVGGTTLTLPGTVNFTGTIQYNGTAVYSLYAITEETIPQTSGTLVIWTSSSFTKPSDEIWVFEIDTYVLGYSGGGVHLLFLNTSNYAYNIFKQGPIVEAQVLSKWIVSAGTTLTVENIRIYANVGSQTIGYTGNNGVPLGTGGAANKFRIYKYRTA